MAPTSTSTSTSSRNKHKDKHKQKRSRTKSKSKIGTSVSVEIKGTVAPTLVTFPNGTIPASASESSSGVSFQRFALKSSSTSSKRTSKLLMGKTDLCTYSARYNNSNTTTTAKYAVGVYNPTHQTLNLYPSTKLCALTQGVIGYKSGFLESHANADAVSSYQARRTALFDAFGSTKKKRVLKSMAANIVSVDTFANAKSLMKNVASHGGDQDDDVDVLGIEDVTAHAFEEARKKLLPPYNANAKAPKDVYQSKSIADEETWSQISRVVTACKAKHSESNTWLDALCSKGNWPALIRQILSGISIEHTSALYQIKTTVLLKHLMSFYRAFKKSFVIGTVEVISSSACIPTPACVRFLELFCSSTSRGGKDGFDMTPQSKDACVIHILVLFVIAHGPKMKVEDISVLCEDIKVEVPKASNMLREAGFVLRKNTSEMVSATLNIPLKFPPPKMRRR